MMAWAITAVLQLWLWPVWAMLGRRLIAAMPMRHVFGAGRLVAFRRPRAARRGRRGALARDGPLLSFAAALGLDRAGDCR